MLTPQRLAGDGVRRIVGKEVDARDEGVDRRDEVVTGRGAKSAASSLRPSPAFAGERREVAGDQLVFGGAG